MTRSVPVVWKSSGPGDRFVVPEVVGAFLEIPGSSGGQLALQRTVEPDPGLNTNPIASPQELPTHFFESGGERFTSEPSAFSPTDLVHRLIQILHDMKAIQDMKSLSGPAGRSPSDKAATCRCTRGVNR